MLKKIKRENYWFGVLALSTKLSNNIPTIPLRLLFSEVFNLHLGYTKDIIYFDTFSSY